MNEGIKLYYDSPADELHFALGDEQATYCGAPVEDLRVMGQFDDPAAFIPNRDKIHDECIRVLHERHGFDAREVIENQLGWAELED